MRKLTRTTLIGAVVAGLMGTTHVQADSYYGNTDYRWFGIDSVQEGADINATDNPFVQPQDPALAGGGRDQTLQFGDVLRGNKRDNLIIGGLGTDVLLGNRGNDVLIGGLEHFNPSNRDRAFGGAGSDIFVWKPGDGSDFFDGGRGHDVMVFGVVGEEGEDEDAPVFAVSNDQVAGQVFLDPSTGLPQVNVSGSPGFCEIIDASSSDDADAQLEALDLDTLVQFSIRGVRNAFEAGDQATDNGLRVTLHLDRVETLVCTSRDGGAIEVFDLTQSPAKQISLHDIPSRKTRARLKEMLF
ncbi:MAG: calcium-binding protein [Lysobacterales bacterium]